MLLVSVDDAASVVGRRMGVCALQCLRLEINLLNELDSSLGQGIGMEAGCYSEGLQLD